MPSKSSSRAHVPDLISTIKKPENQRPASLGHRRSHSETINSKTVKMEKLSNVRPRYLEPKSNHNKLASNLAVKAISHSSSDSSRNSSPSNRHHPPMKKQQNKENDSTNISTNMSRDSLASPAKVNKLTKNKSSHDIDRSIDSLGESMLSSIKTEKTLSQESIIIRRKDNLNKPALKSISRSNPMINKQSTTTTATKTRPLSNKFVNKPRPLSGQTTNQNSPSSVTTKSSRLSSLSSPRDVHKTLNQQMPVKKSFLSAKSKEILAKKQSLNHTDSTKSVPAAVRNERISVNKSQSTSNVPHSNVKPNPFNTTLHLRRTAKVEDEKVIKKSGSNKSIPAMNRNGKMVNGCSNDRNEKKIEKLCVEIESEVEDSKPMRIDSKLERSSTFCKESSDVPLGELQIIE